MDTAVSDAMSVWSAPSFAKTRQIGNILSTLLHPTFKAGLVFGADQPMRAALPHGGGVDIAPRGADRVLDMPAELIMRLSRFGHSRSGPGCQAAEYPGRHRKPTAIPARARFFADGNF